MLPIQQLLQFYKKIPKQIMKTIKNGCKLWNILSEKLSDPLAILTLWEEG